LINEKVINQMMIEQNDKIITLLEEIKNNEILLIFKESSATGT